MKLSSTLNGALLAGALAAGCASTPPAPQAAGPAAAKPTPDTAQHRLETAVNRPKLRVAIGPFQELEAARGLMDKKGWPAVGPLITEQVTTGLVQTGRVTVVERAARSGHRQPADREGGGHRPLLRPEDDRRDW